MAEGETTKHFFNQETSGIPNWAWLLIIVAGLGVGWYLRNAFNSTGSTSNSTTSTYTPVGYTGTDTSTTDTGTGDTGTTNNPPPTVNSPPTPVPPPVYVTVKAWPDQLSTLSGIAAYAGITLTQLLAFPENSQYRNNPNLIYVGQQVRVK